jgi:hypothetical protein
MDYEGFFEGLRECHLANGIPFRHEWPLRIYLMVKNATNCYSMGKKKPKPNKIPKSWGVFSGEKHLNRPPVSSAYKANKNAPSSRDFSFKQDQREVYTIALDLARKIGRLPDNLHNRMVLTADRHQSILAYLDEFGV